MKKLRANLKTTAEKEKALEDILGGFESVLVAFSGGVDSTYLLYKAVRILGEDRVLAVTIDSPLIPFEEIKAAAELAQRLKVKHLSFKIDLLTSRELSNNPPERCYICKKMIYENLLDLAEKHGCKVVLDGSNFDDDSVYRPGLFALRELQIKSPLLESSLRKEEIRALSKAAGLASWNKPAAACLATRIPYGEEINPDKLDLIARAEYSLRQSGITRELRVRCHGNLARIEVNAEDLEVIIKKREEIYERLNDLGFTYITLDLGGFQSGSMDR